VARGEVLVAKGEAPTGDNGSANDSSDQGAQADKPHGNGNGNGKGGKGKG